MLRLPCGEPRRERGQRCSQRLTRRGQRIVAVSCARNAAAGSSLAAASHHLTQPVDDRGIARAVIVHQALARPALARRYPHDPSLAVQRVQVAEQDRRPALFPYTHRPVSI
jgi:hypothetical protein